MLVLLPLLNAKTYSISGGTNNTVQKIASFLLKNAYARAGLKMKPVFMQLEQSLISSNSGQTDGEMARIKKISMNYSNLLIVPVPLITVHAIAFSTNKDIYISKWSDLKDYRVTIVKGTKFIEAATQDINRTLVMHFKDAFHALQEGKTDIIVVPKLAGLTAIFLNKYKNIITVSKPLKSLPLYHFVHKKNANVIPLLTPILQKMRDSGEIAYARRSYLNSITFR